MREGEPSAWLLASQLWLVVLFSDACGTCSYRDVWQAAGSVRSPGEESGLGPSLRGHQHVSVV